ncbi:GNAT family N-acetyltransferase [Candidatus Gottesmanbacteria bacterium CG23_combo_of_CG06-09_8_20_14_all_37_19]|uniref:GNAT family N-acetyltransferase n=2 Tax=Candidatus Gottesmaniibacteriota TaxID=1752720 RepID=A0A1J4TR29_9BACT|nr:MAG: GNAT family N-acetyltransferase [Candidatus Gottesmanbacteria bacterium CG1_02_37_22]PIP32995.1 MAG: GNAT family N-acetyltransferase [Candidatus Gottesmanbacteria bacterium CG23_combo_of_CG06-09_8_20_14_all_37_19]
MYTIRPANREELDMVIDWSAKEGWNPGLYDADVFYKTDPKGFFLGFLDGKPIASISAVAYDDKFGFLGFYIVKPEYRDKGFGIKIWNERLKHLPTQNIGLDGVVSQQENYKKSGFKLAYRDIRYEGKGLEQTEDNPEVVLLKNVPFEKLRSYDDQIFPANRSMFLQAWIKQPESQAIGFIKDGKLLGYGVVRKCKTGFKVGPLFADTKAIANTLFQQMRSFIGKNSPIFIDVPETNNDAVTLAETYQMKPIFETARMYTKEPPNIPINKIFGVTTFELG